MDRWNSFVKRMGGSIAGVVLFTPAHFDFLGQAYRTGVT